MPFPPGRRVVIDVIQFVFELLNRGHPLHGLLGGLYNIFEIVGSYDFQNAYDNRLSNVLRGILKSLRHLLY